MTIKRLIRLLKDQPQNSEVIGYVGMKAGWTMGTIHSVSQAKKQKSDYVLLAIDCPDKLEKWASRRGGK